MKNLLIRLFVSLVLGALFVWLAVKDVDWEKLGHALSQVTFLRLFVYFLLLGLVQVVRVIRWGILLRPIGNIPFTKLFSVGSVGIMALMLFPLRLGEFARPMLIAEKGKIRFSAALATIVLERVIDSLAMVSLLLVLLFCLRDAVTVPLNIHFWAYFILSLFVIAMAFLIVVYCCRKSALYWAKKVLRFFPEKLSNRICSILNSFIDGLDILPNLSLLFWFVVLTVLYWILSGLGMWYMFGAFGGLSSLGGPAAFTVLSFLCVGLMVPAGPAMIGNFHYFVKMGLSLFVLEPVLGTHGVAYALVVHAMQVLQQLVFGIPFLFTKNFSLHRLLLWPTSFGRNNGDGSGFCSSQKKSP